MTTPPVVLPSVPIPAVKKPGETHHCPACGAENAYDAIFCGNPNCRKALGEFRYVREDVETRARWHEALAAHVTTFVGHPYYVLVHALWFALWVAVNTGIIAFARQFDQYPFGLLGILLSIETIFITGFVLITQRRQTAHVDARAEIDYEVSVRTYREVVEVSHRLAELNERLAAVESALPLRARIAGGSQPPSAPAS